MVSSLSTSCAVLPVSKIEASNTDPHADAERRRLNRMAIAAKYNSTASPLLSAPSPSAPSAIVHLSAQDNEKTVLYDMFGRLMFI